MLDILQLFKKRKFRNKISGVFGILRNIYDRVLNVPPKGCTFHICQNWETNELFIFKVKLFHCFSRSAILGNELESPHFPPFNHLMSFLQFTYLSGDVRSALPSSKSLMYFLCPILLLLLFQVHFKNKKVYKFENVHNVYHRLYWLILHNVWNLMIVWRTE